MPYIPSESPSMDFISQVPPTHTRPSSSILPVFPGAVASHLKQPSSPPPPASPLAFTDLFSLQKPESLLKNTRSHSSPRTCPWLPFASLFPSSHSSRVSLLPVLLPPGILPPFSFHGDLTLLTKLHRNSHFTLKSVTYRGPFAFGWSHSSSQFYSQCSTSLQWGSVPTYSLSRHLLRILDNYN